MGSPEPALVRVPSLRNVATTPPYFHDGSAPTLSEAVKTMGIAQLDRVLTDQQIASIVAFLNTLTGTYRGQAIRPATAAPRAAIGAPMRLLSGCPRGVAAARAAHLAAAARNRHERASLCGDAPGL